MIIAERNPCTCGWMYSQKNQSWVCICADLAAGNTPQQIQHEHKADAAFDTRADG